MGFIFFTAGRHDSDDESSVLQLRSGSDELFNTFGVSFCLDCSLPWLSSCLPSRVFRCPSPAAAMVDAPELWSTPVTPQWVHWRRGSTSNVLVHSNPHASPAEELRRGAAV